MTLKENGFLRHRLKLTPKRLGRATRRGTVPLRVARSGAGHDGQGASPWVNVEGR